MTGSRPDPHLPDDLDPTGVRALLANLPDPGPMPQDLVARISQSLALEQERRTTGSAGGTAHPFGSTLGHTDASLGHHDSAHQDTEQSPSEQSPSIEQGMAAERTPDGVISLAAERQRRRPGRTVIWLGGAAAVAMVATFSANQLLGDGSDSNLSAAVPGAHDAADDGAEAGGVAEPGRGDGEGARPDAAGGDSAPAQPEVDSEPPAAAADDSASTDMGSNSLADVVFTATGTVPLSETQLGDQVSDWVATTPTEGTGTWSAQLAADCITDRALQVAGADQVMVSEATWQGEPAMLVVAEHAKGGSAWVLTSDCGEVLTGPISYP